MSYETALKISEVIDDIHKKKYLLPSIQREFVWDPYQIERLFNSKEKKVYMERHYIPDIDLSFPNFINFFEDRERMLKEKFKEALQV